jgi:dihydrofolate synthase / folylpolyglutamate synthase
MTRLLSGLGNPHRDLKSVHIAGTKGKGSTATMLSAMLSNCGLKVGLYTSPHLLDVRERIQINGQMIQEAEMTHMMGRIVPIVRRLGKDEPTYFEILTAMAFLYFAEAKVDLAVVETGMGGRLDSTNVLKPEVCAITSISFDHMSQLGPTLDKIAEEKAGIFKPGVPAISAPQVSEVKAALQRVAARVKNPLLFTGKDIEFSYRFESTRPIGPHTRVSLIAPNCRFEHLPVPMLGEHQAINCGLALSVLATLKERGFKLDDQAVIEGLAKAKLPGRMEIIHENPRIMVDGAHNAASVEALMRAIGQNIPYDSMVVIFGCRSDKDISGMLNHIQLGADKVIFTDGGIPRPADPTELAAEYIERCGKMAQVAKTLEDALDIAEHAVTREDIICITGSFHLVGYAKRLIAARPVVAATNS